MEIRKIVNSHFSFIKNNKRTVLLIVLFFLVQFIISVFTFYKISLGNVENELAKKILFIKKDARYNNGTWDLAAYNSSRDLIGVYPLYFLTLDGFILDRRSPIRGFLDTSDFKTLSRYKSPQSLHTISDQIYRIYTKPVLDQGVTIGIIAVSSYNPPIELLSEVDQNLFQAEKKIASMIKIDNQTIDVRDVSEKEIPYNISYTIIDRFNTVLNKTPNVNNIRRIPNFIDPSYVKYQLNSSPQSIITDSKTKEHFLILRAPYMSKDGIPVGLIIVGQSVEPIFQSLRSYISINAAINSVIIFLILLALPYIFQIENAKVVNKKPKQILFNSKTGILTIDNNEILIPYATNQFYLLQILFSKPTKRWETDEILEHFGENEDKNNWRIIYDTMIKINKKVSKIASFKLIINQNKTYQLHSDVLDKSNHI